VPVEVKATGICHADGFNHGFGLMKSGESIGSGRRLLSRRRARRVGRRRPARLRRT